MVRVVLLGFGNVNSNLIQALHASDKALVVQVFNRSTISLASPLQEIPFTDDINQIADADVYIIGVSDDAIQEFSETLPFRDKLVVHTSGGAAMTTLSNKNRRGVFYPLQTFSKERPVNFKEIPICIEADNANDRHLLIALGKSISKTVVEISSEERAQLHVAAVFVNNFVNYLYQAGQDLLKERDISFDLLKPLIRETASKIENLSPEAAQTGPAKRNDTKTIKRHLNMLEDSPYKEIYTLFTEHLKKQGK